MRTSTFKTSSTRSVTLAHKRCVVAESKFKEMKNRAREARRKRKLAKLLARRAKKQAKEAKVAFADAKELLHDLETKAATTDGGRVAAVKRSRKSTVPHRRMKRPIGPRQPAGARPDSQNPPATGEDLP